MTQAVGVIGFPVQHSISPAFQQAALDYLGLDIVYERWETPPEALAERIASLREPRYLGGNVTVPHKEAVMPLLDDLDSSARAVGAVNTIVKREGRLIGFNTDVAGLHAALSQEGVDVAQGSAVVLGAGGAARAAVYLLLREGNRRVCVGNRTASRARALVDDLRRWAKPGSTQIIAASYDESAFFEAVRMCDLLLNCTSVGMKGTGSEEQTPLAVDLIPKTAFVYDLVYTPAETTLVREARRRGIRAANGLGMLVNQGAEAFRLWTGQEPPLAVMEAAARRALGLPLSL